MALTEFNNHFRLALCLISTPFEFEEPCHLFFHVNISLQTLLDKCKPYTPFTNDTRNIIIKVLGYLSASSLHNHELYAVSYSPQRELCKLA